MHLSGWWESSRKWEMPSRTPSEVWRRKEEGPSACWLLFIASQTRQACKGSRPALGAGNLSSTGPPSGQRNPRVCVRPGTQTRM